MMSLLQILVCVYLVKLLNFMLCCMMVNPSKNSFFYFAYGSNLLKKRILINNPSAVFLGTGCLKGYKVDFVKFCKLWGGAVATIVPSNTDHVWGAVWKMDNDSIVTLDKQEGVDIKEYFPIIVDVDIGNGKNVKCRTYQNHCVPPLRESGERLPRDRRPSITYKECIIRGAIECQLPDEYIDKFRKIPSNGKFGSTTIREKLNL